MERYNITADLSVGDSLNRKLKICILCLTILISTTQVFSLESYIVYNEAQKRVVMEKNSNIRVDPSSLLKPFLAAYLLDNVKGFRQSERIFCPGWRKLYRSCLLNQLHNCTSHEYQACWLRKGHRFVDLELAIAQSCNHYFYFMASSGNIDKESLTRYLRERWGLRLVMGNKIDSFIGELLERKPTLVALTTSYRKIWQSALKKRKYRVIYNGLREVIVNGTLKGVGKKWREFVPNFPVEFIAAKTGTSGANHHAQVIFHVKINQKKYWILYRNIAPSGTKLATTKLFDFLKRNYLRLAYDN